MSLINHNLWQQLSDRLSDTQPAWCLDSAKEHRVGVGHAFPTADISLGTEGISKQRLQHIRAGIMSCRLRRRSKQQLQLRMEQCLALQLQPQPMATQPGLARQLRMEPPLWMMQPRAAPSPSCLRLKTTTRFSLDACAIPGESWIVPQVCFQLSHHLPFVQASCLCIDLNTMNIDDL